MDIFSHIGILPTLAAILNSLALIIWGIRGLIRDHMNDRLARRALEIVDKILDKIPPDQVVEKATEPLRALAKFVEAQHAKPHLPKLPHPRSVPP